MGKIIPVGYIGFKCCSDENLRRIFFASYLSLRLKNAITNYLKSGENAVYMPLYDALLAH
jgi:hypothetical protein